MKMTRKMLPASRSFAVVCAQARRGIALRRCATALLAGNFIDKTPPEGRRQGPEGAILASRAFRQAVPDLRCDVEQMIVAGDRVVSHLHFHGHFTGTFGTRKGKGQNIDFIATDIYQISGGKIAANWHIEDNRTLMKQLGAQ